MTIGDTTPNGIIRTACFIGGLNTQWFQAFPNYFGIASHSDFVYMWIFVRSTVWDSSPFGIELEYIYEQGIPYCYKDSLTSQLPDLFL